MGPSHGAFVNQAGQSKHVAYGLTSRASVLLLAMAFPLSR
jgi:hypothetical protein